MPLSQPLNGWESDVNYAWSERAAKILYVMTSRWKSAEYCAEPTSTSEL